MAIITAAGLVNLDDSYRPFNKNGSVVTLKKISETDWLLFGDIAEGDSLGFADGVDPAFCPLNSQWDSNGAGASFPITFEYPTTQVAYSDFGYSGHSEFLQTPFAYIDGQLVHGTLPSGIADHIRDLVVYRDGEVGTVYIYMRMFETYAPAYPILGLANEFGETSDAAGFGPLTYAETTQYEFDNTSSLWSIGNGTTLCLSFYAPD